MKFIRQSIITATIGIWLLLTALIHSLQDPTIILNYFNRLQSDYPTEKVHLHFDKPYYSLGEDVWFKAYLVNAEKNQLSKLSKVLYVEISKDAQFVKRITLPVVLGLSEGNITLSDSIFSAGHYHLRAYTRWMQNFDSNYFFEKDIWIGDTLHDPPDLNIDRENPGNKEDINFDVQFFPEGGNLVNGIRSKVAFKAIGSDGLSVAVNGYIEDSNKNKLIEISSEHAGMGAFALVPRKEETYTAVLNIPNGELRRFKLPAGLNTGYTLAVNHANDEETLLRISASDELVNNRPLFVVAQVNNVVQFVGKVLMSSPSVSTTVPLGKFTGGIVHFTLLSETLTPLAERLMFADAKEKLIAKIKTDNVSYTTRSPVKLQLSAKNESGMPVAGAFSVAVINQSLVNADEDSQITIKSNLLLSSDLKGYTENPNYYFNEANKNALKHLDLLLLTQGWSRYKWGDVTSGIYPVVSYKPENSLSVNGHVTTLSNKPVTNARLTLLAPSALLALDTVADTAGRFRFDNLDIREGVKFVIKAKDKKDKDYVKIFIDTPLMVFFKNNKVKVIERTFPAFENYQAAVRQQFVEMGKFGQTSSGSLLKEVNIRSKKNIVANSVLDPILQQQATLTIKDDQFKNKVDVLDVLRKQPGLTIRNNQIYGRNFDRTTRTPDGPMLMILDGQIIEDLTPISPETLSGIQIYRNGPLATMIGRPYDNLDLDEKKLYKYGVVILTSNRNRVKSNPFTQNSAMTLTNFGFSVVKEFYAPAYQVKNGAALKDLRTTIFWKPNLIMNSKGTTEINFTTADLPGKYLVTVEGVDIDGHLARSVYEFLVN